MKALSAVTVLAVSLICAVPVVAGTCGPFGMFEGNDYCVNCQGGNQKVYNCPGGEVGRVVVGTQHPGCQISFYDPNTCKGTTAVAVASTSPAPVAAAEGVAKSHASAGKAIVSKEGDEIVIRMTEEDFKKLLALEAGETSGAAKE